MNTKKSAQNNVPPNPNKMNSDFVKKVRKFQRSPERVSEADVNSIMELGNALLTEVEKAILNQSDIGKAHLISNYNEIKPDYDLLELYFRRYLDGLTEQGQSEYNNQFSNTKQFAVEAEGVLGELLNLFHQYWPKDSLDHYMIFKEHNNRLSKQMLTFIKSANNKLVSESENPVKYTKSGKYKQWHFLLADILLLASGSNKADLKLQKFYDPSTERYKRDALINHAQKRHGTDIGLGYYNDFREFKDINDVKEIKNYVNKISERNGMKKKWKDTVLEITGYDEQVLKYLKKHSIK
jgi:hypothetical protein